MERFEEAGVTVVALSYDEPDGLEAFAEWAGISFPLLSDPDSEVIREFGILNSLIDENDHPWFGIPFPGTYVTGADGVITAKFFENNLALRPGVDLLLRAALGEDVSDELVPADPTPPQRVEVSFDLDEGAVVPGTTLATGETLQIFEGDVTLKVCFSHNGIGMRSKGDTELSLTGRVRYQSCDDECCSLPASEPFDLKVELAPIARTRFGNAKEGDMDSLPYLKEMMRRRK